MFKRLAKKIAQKHMELRYPQQPLRLQPDYGERNAADFLGENVVQVNMGYEPLRGGPGNVKDEVIADELEADFLADDFEAEFEAEELEGFEIVDDMGLDRTASIISIDSALDSMGEEIHTMDNVEYRGVVYTITKVGYDPSIRERVVTLQHKQKRITVPTEDVVLVEKDPFRRAKDHEQSGSYMSRQNLREMSDMADFIVDDIGMEGLDDWVEDKISQSYAALNDVARYRGYRDDHPHGEDEESTFKFAEDEIIDDLDDSMDDEIIDDVGIVAEFDKYSRYSKGEKGSKEYADAKAEGKVPEEFLEYEGSVLSPGESPDPSIVEENREEMGKSAHYDIIDDLEW